jgi:ActD protein
MHEPEPGAGPFGLLAEFNNAEKLVDAVRRARRAGFRAVDAYSPFPIEGLDEVLGFHDARVPWLTFAGGVFGGAVGYLMQVYTNLAYPIDIGGRSLVPWQAFMLITFELTVLFAVLFSIGAMLSCNHLPRLHHPLFDLPSFHLASDDKFFLIISGSDAKFDPERTRSFLARLRPIRIDTVSHTEPPE